MVVASFPVMRHEAACRSSARLSEFDVLDSSQLHTSDVTNCLASCLAGIVDWSFPSSITISSMVTVPVPAMSRLRKMF